MMIYSQGAESASQSPTKDTTVLPGHSSNDLETTELSAEEKVKRCDN